MKAQSCRQPGRSCRTVAGAVPGRERRVGTPGAENCTRELSDGFRLLHDAVPPTGAKPVRRTAVGPPDVALAGRVRLQGGLDRRAPRLALGAEPLAGPAGGSGADADQ